MNFDIRFRTPSSFFLAGASQSGKSSFIYKLLLRGEQAFTESFTQVIIVYGIRQEIFDELANHLPLRLIPLSDFNATDLLQEDLRGSCVIFDDAIMSLTNSPAFENLILNSVHHKHFSAILLSQSIFGMGRFSRIISNNCQYVFLWDSCRARLSVQNLARQMYPGEVNYFMAAFRHATSSNAFSPLLIDCSPHVPPALRLRSNFFGLHQIAYLRSNV